MIEKTATEYNEVIATGKKFVCEEDLRLWYRLAFDKIAFDYRYNSYEIVKSETN
jgi:hypothetical protein